MAEAPGVIDSFKGRYAWLSNYAEIPADYDGRTYPTAEHAFAAAKTLDDAERARIATLPTPGEAKKAGRVVDLRPDWDKRIRFEAMAQILQSKFTPPGMLARLCGTGDALLIEGVTWHDQTWGDCDCQEHREQPGQNHLGRALMAIRTTLRGDEPDRWTRVGFTGHRDLDPDASRWVTDEMGRVLRKLRNEHAAATVLNGMAMGADVYAAEAAIRTGLALWAYMPFPDQTARWPDRWVRRQEEIRAKATRFVVLGETPAMSGPRNRQLMLLHGRNRLIVRDSDVLVAVHDRSRVGGGTSTTVGFALDAGMPVITVDPATRTVTVRR